jgi:hypothetical protein
LSSLGRRLSRLTCPLPTRLPGVLVKLLIGAHCWIRTSDLSLIRGGL